MQELRNQIYQWVSFGMKYINIDSLVMVSAAMLLLTIAIKSVVTILDKFYQTKLPMTEFGFRGKLVYVDDNPRSKVFVCKRYELSAKPDFVFKTGLFTYCVVEFKSRKGAVKESDLVQLIATVIAVRSKHSVTRAMVVTSGVKKELEIASSGKMYKSIKKLHREARRVKHLNKKPKALQNNQKCNGCGYREHCEED